MSVVFINHPLETFTPTASGALATIIWECCRQATAEGLSPTVVTRSSAAQRFSWDNTIALDYPAIPTNPALLKIAKAQRRLTGWNHLRHKAYAVKVAAAVESQTSKSEPLVLINDPEMTIYLRSRFPNRRIVHWFENQQQARPRVKRDYAASASVTCGVSNFTSRWVGSYYGVSGVKTLYNGVDSEQFTPAAQPLPGVPIINFVGRTGIEKAPDLVLRAALQVAKTTREFGVQLVGSNHWDRFEMDAYQKDLCSLEGELKSLGIAVTRPGHVGRTELPAEFRKAHIHVVPSRWDEPFGLTTVEGMASGLATVASNTGGTPEVIGEAGKLFAKDSVEELTACLLPLVRDADLREEYGRLARKRSMQFSWKQTWTTLKEYAGI